MTAMLPAVSRLRSSLRTGRAEAVERDGSTVAAPVWAWLSVVPVLLATAWLLVALPLLLAGALRPLPSLLLTALLAAVLLAAVLPRLPRPRGLRDRDAGPAPAWALLAAGAVALAFGVLSALTHSEHVIVRRDAGAYAQISYWLAEHGRLPIQAGLAAFGGPDPALATSSPAFYPDGGAVVPQFMTGMPMTLAVGHWLAGWTGALVLPAVLTTLALFAAGGLTARLVGARWAPLAMLTVALAQPVLHVAGGTYSEPLAQLFLLGGLCLLIDALPDRGGGGGDRVLAAVAGLVLGLSLLVRIDAGRELALLLPVVGWLYVRRRPEATPLLAGLVVGAGYGVVDGIVLSRPYLRDISGSLVPMVALLALIGIATAAAVPLLRRRATPLAAAGWWRPVPAVAAGAVVLAGALFAIRPLLQTVRAAPTPQTLEYIETMQRRQGLTQDGSRLYSEDSLHWLAWYLGWPLLLLALAGAALLVYRVLRRPGDGADAGAGAAGRNGAWVPVLLVVLGATALTLWRPGITPDHPWADRRFVPVILPGLVLFAVYALAGLYRRLRGRVPAAARAGVLAAGVLALTVPAAVASAPLLLTRTEVGEVGAMNRACGAFAPGEVALIVDERGRNEWTQVLRGACGVPAAAVPDPDPATVARLIARAEAAGSRVVLVAGDKPDALNGLGGMARQVVRLVTRQDQQLLTARPWRTETIVISLWTAPAGRPG